MQPRHLLTNVTILFHLMRLLRHFPFDPSYIRALQLRKLKRLLRHAYMNFDFYRERMDQAHFVPDRIRDVSELAALPRLTKAEYRAFTQCLLQQRPERYANGYQDSTSGSTGTPMKIYRTWNERAYMLAKYLRVLFLNGYRPNYKTLSIVSPHRLRSRDSIVQKLGIMPRYSVPYTDPPESLLASYLRVAPDFLYANKAQLVQMAYAAHCDGIRLPPPRMFLCAGETLDDTSKRLIQSVFGADNMCEVYGAVEFNTLAFRSRGSDFFHFCHDTNLLELDNDGVINSRAGHCLITDLHICSMPLIRYELGDWIEADDHEGIPIISSIRGRLDDWIMWRDGTRIPFHVFYEIMGRHESILQFRIVQETLDLIRIAIVLDKQTRAEEVRAILCRDLADEVRRDVSYKLEFVDRIGPDPSGKLRMVISNVDPGLAKHLL